MKARKVKGLDPQAPLAGNAAEIVRTRVVELHSFAPAALGGEPGAQHDLRIAAKRLRYALELTGFCFGESAEAARGGARELQEVLGDLHDCDVMLPRVREQLEMTGGADRGLELLVADLEARRGPLFDRFQALWSGLARDGVWDQLADALGRRDA